MFSSNEDAKGKCLRIGLEAAGCNGQKYAFKFDDKKADDVSFAQPGFEVVVDPDEMCFPMVPAGGSNDNIVMGPEDL